MKAEEETRGGEGGGEMGDLICLVTSDSKLVIYDIFKQSKLLSSPLPSNQNQPSFQSNQMKRGSRRRRKMLDDESLSQSTMSLLQAGLMEVGDCEEMSRDGDRWNTYYLTLLPLFHSQSTPSQLSSNGSKGGRNRGGGGGDNCQFLALSSDPSFVQK